MKKPKIFIAKGDDIFSLSSLINRKILSPLGSGQPMIGDMSAYAQAKILRTIERKDAYRLGEKAVSLSTSGSLQRPTRTRTVW